MNTANNKKDQSGDHVATNTHFSETLTLAQSFYEQGDLQQAESICLGLLDHDPTQPEVLALLGIIAYEVGSLDMACLLLKQAIQLHPYHHHYHYYYSQVLHDLQQSELAIIHAQQAIVLKPNFSPAYRHLAKIMIQQTRWIEAIAQLQIAVQIGSGSSDTNQIEADLKQVLVQSGYRLEEALTLGSEQSQLEYSSAEDLIREQKYDQAIKRFWKALQLKPNNALAYFRIADLLYGNFKLVDGAIDCYKASLYWDPTLINSYCNLGRIYYFEKGSLDQAIDILDQALQINSESLAIKTILAEYLCYQGQWQRARSLLQPLIDSKTNRADVMRVFAQILDHAQEKPEAIIQLIKDCLKDEDLPLHNKTDLLYELGYFFDKTGAYEDAFRAYQQANDRNVQDFDSARCRKFNTDLIQNFTAEFFSERSRTQHNSEKLIFIVGMPRSGTSLTEQILSCHPEVHAAGELMHIPKLVAQLPLYSDPSLPFPKCIHHINLDHLDRLAEKYIATLSELDPQAGWITDKLPGNFLYLGVIAWLFPHAHIIHCQRHPLDTCLSCYFNNFGSHHLYTRSLENLGIYYCEYKRLMQHWQQALPTPFFNLQYEQLVTDPETQIRSLLDYCSLSWWEGCLNFHQSSRVVPTISVQQVRQPFYTRSIGRYQAYESYLEPLKQILKQCDQLPLTAL